MTQHWKVGAVAAASGLTIRTLHHWDEIGLLSPSRRGAGGHREYTEEDLGRLYVVLTLRDLGLELETIRNCVEAGIDPHRLLADHLARLDQGIESLSRLRARVAGLVETTESRPDAASVLEVLELMRAARDGAGEVLARHLDEDQLSALAEGAIKVGPAQHYLLEVEWPHLYRQVDGLRRQGAATQDTRVQRLVARMDELSAMFAGEHVEVSQGVRWAWREDPAAMSGQLEDIAAPLRDLADFVEGARAQRKAAAPQVAGRVGGGVSEP